MKDLTMDLLTVTCLVSAVVSFVFALVIFTLRRSARILQEKKWAIPFASTFFVLAGIYAVKFYVQLPHGNSSREWIAWTSAVVTFSASGVTNYLFCLAAFRLSEPAIRKRWFVRLRTVLVERWPATLIVLCSAGLIQMLYQIERLPDLIRILVLLPDNILSAVALLSMGLALSRNIRFRPDRLMARVAFLSSVGYALLYLAYGLKSIIVGGGADVFVFMAALLLKVGLFFPALSLLLLVSAPLTGIERLLKNITRKDREYLESEGIVRSICEELHLNRVELYVPLPGKLEKQIARFSYPLPKDDVEDPQIFTHQDGTDYDRVLRTGEPYIVNREEYAYSLIHRISKVSVPLFFHNAVIGCLKAETREERFTEVDLSNLKRIAIMVSPAVQTYREMFALNKLSHDLSALKIEVVEFDLERDLANIARLVHNVASSHIVGLLIEAGFEKYRACYPADESIQALVKDALETAEKEDFQSEDGLYRWLVNDLKISPPGKSFEPQTYGKFILGFETKNPVAYPPIGTSPICRRALTDLVNDTLLDFIRGYLNQLTDKLGEKLSGLRGTTLRDWHEVVASTARLARIPWVVVTCSERRDDQRLGEPVPLRLIERTEQPDCECREKASGFCLYLLDLPEGRKYCIQRKLTQSRHTIWFGVATQTFGAELDFISPWTYFLDHFCTIADSSLRLLEDRKRHINTIKHIRMINHHDVVNRARAIHSMYMRLISGLNKGTIQCSEKDKRLIKSYQSIHDHLDKMLQTSSQPSKYDERHGKSIDFILKSVLPLVEGQLAEHEIKFETIESRPGNSATLLDVPVYVAANLFLVLFDNARDALKYEKTNGNRREIKVVIDDSTAEHLTCSFIDNGPGVPPGLVHKLFVEPCQSSKPHSIGLGLFSAVHLLWAFDGNIAYYRQPENGNGTSAKTVFCVTFPRYQRKRAAEAGLAVMMSNQGSTKLS